MRRFTRIASLFLLAVSLSGVAGCIIVPDGSYDGPRHHHHWGHDGGRGWR